MKKFFLAAVLIMGALTANAQKKVMYAGSFTYADNIEEGDVLAVRTAIVSGIIDTQRFDLIDADSKDQLNTEAERRSSEEAMADKAARAGAMQEKAAEYLLYGYIAQCEGIKKIKDDGTVQYTGEVKYTVKVVQASDKKVIASKDFNLSGLKCGIGDSPQSAINDALRHVKNDMKNFVDENFKLKAIVLGEGYEAKTKKEKHKENDEEVEVEIEVEMLTCLVTLGSDHGIEKGQRLDVSVTSMIAGREVNKVIGQLTVQEVMAGDLSQCKVNKGGKEIMTAMKEYLTLVQEAPENAKPLQVVTKKQGGLKNFGKQAGAMFGF